ncbi:MAG: metallophosphoesterase [Chitinophagaceae bacterium]
MKIISYSDLHFEFGSTWLPPVDIESDLMILSGDIITFRNYRPLSRLLKNWNRPVLYVIGNHEYYTQRPKDEEETNFKLWLAENHPNVKLLFDEAIIINGINFFGGTMWTNFNHSDPLAMMAAGQQMNDFKLIKNSDGTILKPFDTIQLHDNFVAKLTDWFNTELIGPRVIISHHAPVVNANTQYRNSPLMPAFNSLDMVEVIKKYQPALWIYGHTHECDNQMIGKTKILSNQLGYPIKHGYECPGFDIRGMKVEIKHK